MMPYVRVHARLCLLQIRWTEATMAHRVMQISRDKLEELREAFNKIG